MRILQRAILCGAMLAACREESIVGPFGLRLRVLPKRGSVAEAIRGDATEHPDCPTMPDLNPEWPSRSLSKPVGRVSLPVSLEGAAAPSSEVVFFAPDMSAGAFVAEAPSLASIEIPPDSPQAGASLSTRRLQAGGVESVVYLISQRHPTGPADSVHLAFLQLALAGDRAVRAGAFAASRALRDSLVRALLTFDPTSP